MVKFTAIKPGSLPLFLEGIFHSTQGGTNKNNLRTKQTGSQRPTSKQF